jgi:hypothetical protein
VIGPRVVAPEPATDHRAAASSPAGTGLIAIRANQVKITVVVQVQVTQMIQAHSLSVTPHRTWAQECLSLAPT